MQSLGGYSKENVPRSRLVLLTSNALHSPEIALMARVHALIVQRVE